LHNQFGIFKWQLQEMEIVK